MRGGAQAHLLRCDDGQAWVTKFRDNPQSIRILANEMIAASILDHLRLSTPAVTPVEISEALLAREPAIALQFGPQTRRPSSGWHFGSCYPGDPDRIVVYDFLPDVILPTVANLAEFLGVLCVDKWLGNADSRQAIFYHRNHEGKPRLFACMIDHGYIFDGPNWTFSDSPLQGLYLRPSVYAEVRGWDAFEPWLDTIQSFPESALEAARREVPPTWLSPEEESQLDALLERLLSRRKRVPDLVRDCKRGRIDIFPRWNI
jgi:hypothetical protein